MITTEYANETVRELAAAIEHFAETVADYTAMEITWLGMSREHPREPIVYSNLAILRDLKTQARADMEHMLRTVDTSIVNNNPPF